MTASRTAPAGAGGIVVQADDRARVDAGRPEQLVAVLLRAATSSARAGARAPAANACSRSRAKNPRCVRGDIGPGHAIRLLVDVDRRVRVLVQRPVGAPGGERPGRAAVAIVGLVAGLVRPAGRGGRRWPDGGRAGAPPRPRRSRRTAARRRAPGRRSSPGRSGGRGTDGSRARDLTEPACRPAALGTAPSYDSGRSDADGPCNFRGVPGVLAATTPDPERTWSVRAPSPVHATPLPGRSPRLRGSWPPSRSSSPRSGPVAAPAAAADGLTMEARILLGGHARLGSWIAIAVHLKNDGPAITGELRLAGGTQGQTRFGTAVDLPTQSDKIYVLYAQPPAFGSELEVELVDGEATIASTKATFTDPRRHPARRRRRRRAPRGDRRQPRPAAEPEPGRAGRRDPDPRRPARAGRGLGGDRPHRLAGRRLRAAVDRRSVTRSAAGSPAAGGWSSPAGRPVPDALGLPRQPPPLPTGRHDRRPRRQPERPPRRAPADRDAAAGPVRRR